MKKHTGANIDNLDQSISVGFHKYILRFQVAVNNVQLMKRSQSQQDLFSYHLQFTQCKILGLAFVGII